MKKKIDVRGLRLGMYVCELDRPWLETPGLLQGFELKSREQLEQIQRFCKSVYIETKLQTTEPAIQPGPHEQHNKLTGFSNLGAAELELEILKIYTEPHQPHQIYPDKTTVEEEAVRIQDAYQETVNLAHTIMEDARLGRRINAAAARAAITEIVGSIIRNPDALMCFIQLRRKNENIAQHGLRVCILALVLGRHIGLDLEGLQNLGIGAILHDLGKTRIPGEILHKTDERSAKEKEILKKHVFYGVGILESTKGIPPAAIDVARFHHEHYDGSGYMQGLTGDRIGQFGLIGGIVNHYDVITSDSNRSKGLTEHTALKVLYERRYKAFHPQLVEEFIRCIGIYPIGSVVEMNTGEVGVVVTVNRIHRLRPKVTLVLQADNKSYKKPETIDLAEHRNAANNAYEISSIADADYYNINPADYLPVTA